MSRKLIFDKKQVSEQFFGGENMSKKMSSCPSRVYTGFEQKDKQRSSRVYTGFRAKRWATILPVFERKTCEAVLQAFMPVSYRKIPTFLGQLRQRLLYTHKE